MGGREELEGGSVEEGVGVTEEREGDPTADRGVTEQLEVETQSGGMVDPQLGRHPGQPLPPIKLDRI